LFADDRGYIRFEFNHQDDRAIFYLPMPLAGPPLIPHDSRRMNINNGTTGASRTRAIAPRWHAER